MTTTKTSFSQALASGRLVLTAECVPPHSGDPEAVKKLSAVLPPALDAVVVADNPDEIHGSALACAALLAARRPRGGALHGDPRPQPHRPGERRLGRRRAGRRRHPLPQRQPPVSGRLPAGGRRQRHRLHPARRRPSKGWSLPDMAGRGRGPSLSAASRAEPAPAQEEDRGGRGLPAHAAGVRPGRASRRGWTRFARPGWTSRWRSSPACCP